MQRKSRLEGAAVIEKSNLLREMRRDLRKHSSKARAKVLRSFFKTGPGGYAEGDIFIGVPVPRIREVALKYTGLEIKEIIPLLKSSVHEERLLALLILVLKYERGIEIEKEETVRFYLRHTKYINNWDLVDLTAPKILGAFFSGRDSRPLFQLAGSDNLWERRIAIVATYYFIRNNRFEDTLRIAEMLMFDKEELAHRAAGWMLREVGKRDAAAEEAFLRRNYRSMPRLMLRCAIERLPERKRQAYLKGKA